MHYSFARSYFFAQNFAAPCKHSPLSLPSFISLHHILILYMLMLWVSRGRKVSGEWSKNVLTDSAALVTMVTHHPISIYACTSSISHSYFMPNSLNDGLLRVAVYHTSLYCSQTNSRKRMQTLSLPHLFSIWRVRWFHFSFISTFVFVEQKNAIKSSAYVPNGKGKFLLQLIIFIIYSFLWMTLLLIAVIQVLNNCIQLQNVRKSNNRCTSEKFICLHILWWWHIQFITLFMQRALYWHMTFLLYSHVLALCVAGITVAPDIERCIFVENCSIYPFENPFRTWVAHHHRTFIQTIQW